MRRHFDILAQFEAKVADNPELKAHNSQGKWEAMDASQRIVTLQMAMKVHGTVLGAPCTRIAL